VWVRVFGQDQLGNRRQKAAWGIRDPLCVNKVTRVVVTNSPGQCARRRTQADFVEPLTNIPRLARQCFPATGQPLTGFAQRGPASRGIADDRIQRTVFLGSKGLYIRGCELTRHGDIAGVGV
jgi:hypothetical protein